MSCTECESPFEFCVEEGGTRLYSAILKDEDEQPVPLASLDGLTVTIVDDATGEVINDREEVDVKNANGGTYHATDGTFTFRFAGADNPIVDNESRKELHIATFQATWGATGRKNWDVHVKVQNLKSVSVET